jgi:hypothetical protein
MKYINLNKFSSKIIKLVLGSYLLLLIPLSHATNYTVCAIGLCNFTTVTDAINGASSGDTLLLDLQNFNESIVIDKDLTIIGSGLAGTGLTAAGGTTVSVVQGVTVKITDLWITGGYNYEGGGVNNLGSLTLKRVFIHGNHATINGGGIWTSGPLNLNDVLIDGNSVEINGPAGGYGGGLYIEADDQPGRITVNIMDSTISGNITCNGGGIFNSSQDLNIFRTQIINNEAGPGGVECVQGSVFNDGGGLYISGIYSGVTKIVNSTISGNIAAHSGGAITAVYGVTLSVTNTTISRNVALTAAAIKVKDDSFLPNTTNVAINSSTITENAGIGGSIVLLSGTPSLTLRNTIVANQTMGTDCGGGNIISAGHNLESGTSCNFTNPNDIQNSSMALLPLANNGGLTQTHALPLGHPAIDAAAPLFCFADTDVDGVVDIAVSKDQRAVVRPFGGCDIGAFEL